LRLGRKGGALLDFVDVLFIQVFFDFVEQKLFA